MPSCTVDQCERKVRCKDLCASHYERLRVRGRLERKTGLQRFIEKTTPGEAPLERPDLGACVVWAGAVSNKGYGTFWDGQGVVKAHRWAYQNENGPIEDDLVLDHLCRNRRCVRPSHLEAVTSRVNTGRGLGNGNSRKTHCPKGHSYADDNLYIAPRGNRVCRACARATALAYKRRTRPA